MSRSADVSFRLIALAKKILTQAQVDAAVADARQRGLSLEQVVSDDAELPADQFERILRTRRRHARSCSACGKTTFLLPRQTEDDTPCEHCGDLLLRPEEAASLSLRPQTAPDLEARLRQARPSTAYHETGPRPTFKRSSQGAEADSDLSFSDEAPGYDTNAGAPPADAATYQPPEGLDEFEPFDEVLSDPFDS